MKKVRYSTKKHNFILIYIITTIIIMRISFSKYVTTVSSDGLIRVAVMANSVSIDIDLSNGVYPGFETIYPIVISNKEEKKVCDVTQQFIIEIEREEIENVPFIFEMYQDKDCTQIIEKDENGNYSSEGFKFDAGIEQTKKYYLKISWPENENDESLAFEIGYLKINIIAQQID